MLKKQRGGNSKGFENIHKLKYHYIYLTTNLINQKVYLGRHSTNNLDDGYMGSGTLLKRSLKKYGIQNFKIEILSYHQSFEEVVLQEELLVTKEWCDNPYTYNISTGGPNPRLYGKNNPAWKGGISTKKKGPFDYSGENNPRYGYNYSQEEKDSMIVTQKNRKTLSIDGVQYKSIREASRKLGMSRDGIKYRCIIDKYPTWICHDKIYSSGLSRNRK